MLQEALREQAQLCASLKRDIVAANLNIQELLTRQGVLTKRIDLQEACLQVLRCDEVRLNSDLNGMSSNRLYMKCIYGIGSGLPHKYYYQYALHRSPISCLRHSGI